MAVTTHSYGCRMYSEGTCVWIAILYIVCSLVCPNWIKANYHSLQSKKDLSVTNTAVALLLWVLTLKSNNLKETSGQFTLDRFFQSTVLYYITKEQSPLVQE